MQCRNKIFQLLPRPQHPNPPCRESRLTTQCGNNFSAGCHAHRLKDSFNVVFGRMLADEEPIGDLPVAHPLAQDLENFCFPFRQPVTLLDRGKIDLMLINDWLHQHHDMRRVSIRCHRADGKGPQGKRAALFGEKETTGDWWPDLTVLCTWIDQPGTDVSYFFRKCRSHRGRSVINCMRNNRKDSVHFRVHEQQLARFIKNQHTGCASLLNDIGQVVHAWIVILVTENAIFLLCWSLEAKNPHFRGIVLLLFAGYLSAMNNFTNSRLLPREELTKSISLDLWNAEAGIRNIQVEALGIDINSCGIGITTRQALAPGDIVKIDYPLSGGTVALPVYSEVVWSTTDRGNCRAGLRFL